MNLKCQNDYLKSVKPEVMLALEREYPVCKNQRFLNTKYIKEQIRMYPQDFPILAAKSDKHVTEVITTVLGKKMGYREFNKSTHRVGVRIFVRGT